MDQSKEQQDLIFTLFSRQNNLGSDSDINAPARCFEYYLSITGLYTFPTNSSSASFANALIRFASIAVP